MTKIIVKATLVLVSANADRFFDSIFLCSTKKFELKFVLQQTFVVCFGGNFFVQKAASTANVLQARRLSLVRKARSVKDGKPYHQGDQMARFIVQFLALYNKVNLPNSKKKQPKQVQNFAEILKKSSKFNQRL